jgi:hypothetical protein
MKLKELFNSHLPINRKERFYTGTVFPMIVCKNNFENFNLFTNLLEDCSGIKIDANPETTNIQFFTEYSLKESAIDEETKKRFCDMPDSKDTPDIIILIEGEINILIAIEAKMYDYPKPIDLVNQMEKQKKILNCIKRSLSKREDGNDFKIYHYALLPEGYFKYGKPEGINIITWQQLLNAYKDVYGNDYFIGMLECALDKYTALVGKGIDSFGYNSKDKISGQKVYEDFKNGVLEMKTIGRNKGIAGFVKDIEENKWRTVKYETSSKSVQPNDNWITVEKFVELVENVIV